VNRIFTEIEGRKLSLSNLEKDLYPSFGFTKAQVLEYYRRISPVILPHLVDRALTLKRYPNGVEEESFFEKRCPSHRPNWVQTAEISQKDGEQMTVCLANDLGTLIWVENLASIELHVPQARAHSPNMPDSVVFDLDPGHPADILDCAKVALILKDLLSGVGVMAWVKTSGKKGIHVFVPLTAEGKTFEDTKRFSKTVAEVLERNYPDLVTSKMAKEYRRGKVFINWSQNDSSKTMVCVYSLRAGSIPAVSFPLSWNDLNALHTQGNPEKFKVTPSEAISIAESQGDLFREMITMGQKLP
jgi:bifunctional non-homologous end joining protein LigD